MPDRRSEFPDYVMARRGELRRLAFALCGHWHSADDIVQIALSKLYRAWPRIKSTAAEDAYARRIVARTAIDESRRPWRRERPNERPDDMASDQADPVISIDILRALSSLPPQQHKVVVLRHWLGLSVADTAAVLGISDGTVKSQAAKAMAKLRPLLDETFERTQP